MSVLKYPHLFEPIILGNQIFKNRIFCSPTGCQNLIENKYPAEDTIAYYARKAMGGAATATVGEGIVDLNGRGGPNNFDLWDHNGMTHISKLTNSVSRYNCVPVIELQHAGMFAHKAAEEGAQIYAPSEQEIVGGVVHADEHDILPEMPEEVIEDIIRKYGDAAAYAKACGFGMVLIHGGHGWLLSQFISPNVNKRKDQWGGSLENRMRLPLAIVENIRKKCGPRFPIEFRMSGDECTPNGYGFDEGMKIAQMLDGKVDLIHVSTGHHESQEAFTRTHPSLFDPDGVNLHYAADIKKLVSTPVATVGAHNDPELMEEIIASGQADVIEMARGLIADPDMPRKARCGKPEDVRQCLRCFTCFSNELTNERIICAVNPEIGHEKEFFYTTTEAKVKKKVLVVGGGIGGMQAALEASKAGHEVILCEKKGVLGGTLRCEDEVPFKQKLRRYMDQQARLVQEANIDLRMNTEVTPEMAEEIAPDVIIAAVGARPAMPPVKGIKESPIVVGAEDVYYHPEKAGKKVITLGGGLVGVELSLYVAGNGSDVTIVEMLPELSNGGNILHQIALDKEIAARNVKIHLSTKAMEITDKGLLVEYSDGTQEFLEADTVIYATGQRPLWDEAKALAPCAPDFYMIGDCIAPKNIYQATQMATNIVRTIGRL